MKSKSVFVLMLWTALGAGIPASAQFAAPPPAPQIQLRSTTELDQMLGPIALYPDPLIAQILPAATGPTEIVLAYRFVSAGNDVNLVDQQPWTESVKALARYPSVLKMMNDNLAWTIDLGRAFLYQQQDVMNSIQRLRAEAARFGNLQSTPQITVTSDGGFIEIVPANPEIIYVPVYQPAMVFYQRPFGRTFISFGIGLRIGAWLNHDFDWFHRTIVVWDHVHPRPPNWWRERPSRRLPTVTRNVTVWHPPARSSVLEKRPRDRGWGVGTSHPIVVTPQRSPVRNVHESKRPGAGPAPTRPRENPVKPGHPAPVRTPGGAFIGVDNARDTRAASSRGERSLQTVRRPSGHSKPAQKR